MTDEPTRPPLDGVEPLPPFLRPSAADFARAEAIVNSHPVVSAYAACEFDCLDDGGKVWIAAIVREAVAQARTPTTPAPPIKGDERDHGLGPNAVAIDDDNPDGFAPVWMLAGSLVYLAQVAPGTGEQSLIVMSAATARKLSAALSTGETGEGERHG